MTFKDKNISCCKCQKTFVFSIAEQESMYALNLSERQQRCPDCRQQAHTELLTSAGLIECIECKIIIARPFFSKSDKAKSDKPAYCSSCSLRLLLTNEYKFPYWNLMCKAY